jgi:hypothetical protein
MSVAIGVSPHLVGRQSHHVPRYTDVRTLSAAIRPDRRGTFVTWWSTIWYDDVSRTSLRPCLEEEHQPRRVLGCRACGDTRIWMTGRDEQPCMAVASSGCHHRFHLVLLERTASGLQP